MRNELYIVYPKVQGTHCNWSPVPDGQIIDPWKIFWQVRFIQILLKASWICNAHVRKETLVLQSIQNVLYQESPKYKLI